LKLKVDPLALIKGNPQLNPQTREKITTKTAIALKVISEIEKMSGVSYPQYYVEPVLTLAPDAEGSVGILYARTIPLEKDGEVIILVQLSAALILFGTKPTLRLIVAHEFLHYLELVKRFHTGMLLSEISSDSLFEEGYEDQSRAIDPALIFPRQRRLVQDLRDQFLGGFSNEKLADKCQKSWIEKGLPAARIPLGSNQVKIPMAALVKSNFDPDVVRILDGLNR
jgi:hypothetical protein